MSEGSTDRRAHLEIRERVDELWDWHLIAANDEELCGTSQGYRDTHDAMRGFDDTIATLAALLQSHIGAVWAEGHLAIDVVNVPRSVQAEPEETLDAETAKHTAKHAERATRSES